jgi:hypothetical protein
MLERALKRFARYPGRYFGLDLDAHRAELRAWLDRIERGDAGRPGLEAVPKWRFDPAAR